MTTRQWLLRSSDAATRWPRWVIGSLIAVGSAAALPPASAEEFASQRVQPTRDFVLSPAAHVAVDALIGVFRNAQAVDERVARLAAEIERTQAIVAAARSDAGAGRGERARESLRQHAIRIRALEAEFERSSATERPNGSIEALRPQLDSLRAAMARVSHASGRAETSAELDALDARLRTDLRVGDRSDSLPRPTVRQLGHPHLRVPSESIAPGPAEDTR